MGIFVEVTKLENEDENFVYYKYQFSLPTDEYKTNSGKVRYKVKVVSGSLKLEKRNGELYIIELAEGDGGSHVNCAYSALLRHWRKGEYPDKTFWES